MSAPKRRAADPVHTTARLIQRCASTDPGATLVAGTYFRALPLRGLNGQGGFQRGHYERWLNQEGVFTLDMPNSEGPDGKQHIKRFLQQTDPNWVPGDEWIELRRDDPPVNLYTGALINMPQATLGLIQVSGYDALWLLKKVRETEAGFWVHAPRDALEHYSRCWIYDVASAFPEPGAATVTPTTGTTTGSFIYVQARTDTGIPVCRLTPVVGGQSSVTVANAPPNVGYNVTDPYAAWRVETSVYIAGPFPTGANVILGSGDLSLGVEIYSKPSVASGLGLHLRLGTTGQIADAAIPGAALVPGTVSIALEGRERWMYAYVQGQLVGIIPMRSSHTPPATVTYQAVTGAGNVDVQSLTYERAVPWLMRGSDKGDYQLPGAPVPGGLWGEYYDESDLWMNSYAFDYGLSPTKTPYQQRLDPTLSFAAGTWFPPGPGLEVSMRWVGSVYLDLANYDFRLKLTTTDASRLWIGKTRFGEQMIDQWPVPGTASPIGGAGTTPYLRSQLGSKSGWYPIKIEMITGAANASSIVLAAEVSNAPGVFNTLGPNVLSPFGIYQNQVRRDSHFDTYKAIASAFGYQFTCQPQTLESGLFPGQVIPRVRQGRDTQIRVSEDDATELAVNSSGEDMAIKLVADAQGLADPSSSAQLSATVVDYGQAKGHMLTVTDVESLSDITDRNLLSQRLTTLLALRSGTWDQITSRPQGFPALVDNWPAPTVSLPTRFAYEPGDGVFRKYPRLGVVDLTPQQLMQIAWDFTPYSIQAPQAAFYIYPRNVYLTLRRYRQQAQAHDRNYQGQTATYQGTLGGRTGTAGGSPTTVAADQYSRLVLPATAAKSQKVWLAVTVKLDTTKQWTVEVNGATTPILANSAGRYDVSAYIGEQVSGTQRQMVARLIPPGAGTYDSAEWMLVAQVIV